MIWENTFLRYSQTVTVVFIKHNFTKSTLHSRVNRNAGKLSLMEFCYIKKKPKQLKPKLDTK